MRSASLISVLLVLTTVGCDDAEHNGALDDDAGFADVRRPLDRPPEDAPQPLDVTPIDPCNTKVCGPTELCGPALADGARGSGNGVDDNCDGRVDELCPCMQGETRPCFPGPPDRRAVGACQDGLARCTELGAWVGNECRGATVPAEETCNGRDDDCDGSLDNGVADCATSLRCPASAGAAPLQEFTLDGRTIDPMATRFQWSVRCPEGLTPCPAPTNPADPTLRVSFARAGQYRVTLMLQRDAGPSNQCVFPLYVQGRGLRVELDWDRKGGESSPGVDMDLHVAPIDRRRATSFAWFTPDDCYFLTCKAPGGTVNWNLDASDHRFAPSTTAESCQGYPPPFGDAWRAAGRCWNPRLDVDNISCDPTVTDGRNPLYCFPENVSVDDPPDEVTFRLMVNYYLDHGICTDADPRNDIVHPTLTVECGGVQRAALGSVDDGLVEMACADNRSLGSSNWSWLAADVRVQGNACGLRDCRVTPLRASAGRFVPCAMVTDASDVCMDARGRVFVRRAGARPIDVEFAESR